ncbi:hypothetical protein [Actinokineospora globicatena]|uniref:hypothetical protein n=1 Tax=Actinokineospora globicatena TaxID=103729 RepID=UPI0020A38C1F|nr:hypothetical protein [Actinokineospora globicatena]MCP2303697.1 hypothetical protein [Actinokineospora globicatena]GLW79165.1 hypothetical protein Aglo01_36470 [Actinokineospora globicatena]GLW86425.1 hypothetical protein Aglo02_40640 [Actinokineospora globicatena]
MPRIRTVLMSLAMTAAAGTLAVTGASPAAATTVADGSTHLGVFQGCASLYSNKPGRAQIKNICSKRINATVSVDWAWDPDCIAINPGRILSVTWDSTAGKADYAYEC